MVYDSQLEGVQRVQFVSPQWKTTRKLTLHRHCIHKISDANKCIYFVIKNNFEKGAEMSSLPIPTNSLSYTPHSVGPIVVQINK